MVPTAGENPTRVWFRAVPGTPVCPATSGKRTVNDGGQADELFRELVESLLWIVNQTRPNTAKAVLAVARHLHEPKDTHWKEACKAVPGTPPCPATSGRRTVNDGGQVDEPFRELVESL